MSMSALSGDIVNVSGTRTATAMVAVNPGIEPMIVPAATPRRASSRFSGDNAPTTNSSIISS